MNEAKRSLYRNTSSLRGIALFTLPLFFATQVFLPLPESLAMPGLPTGQADSRQARSAPNTQVTEGDPVTATATGQVLNGTIAVPSELGLVDEVYRATVNGQRTTSDFSEKENALRVARSTLPAAEGRKTIVFVQDAHDSLEAQENIAKIIEHLVANYGVKTVFEEGYEGTVPTDEFFGFIQDPVLKQKVSYFFLDKLRIGGAEYAHINRATHNAQRKTGEVLSLRVERDTLPAVQSAATAEWQLIGADSLELHRANVDQYRFSASKKDAVRHDLKALEKELKQLADRRFPKPLKEWLKLKGQFDAKKLDLLTYLTRTIELIVPQEAKHGKVPRNAQRTTSEKKSNKNTLSVERCPLPKTFILPLLQFLVEAAKSNDPVVLEKVKHIDAREVFTALGDLENTVEEAFLKSPEDKKLFRYVQTLDLLDRLNNLQVTQEEYTALKSAVGFAPRDLYLARNQNESRVPSLESREGRFLPPPFVDTQGLAEFIHKQTGKPLVLSKQWERNIKEAVKFYEIAQQRDSALAAVIDKYFLQKRNGQRTTRNGQRQPVRQAGPTDNAQRESDSLSVARSTLSKPVRSAADLKLPDSETAILVYGGFHKENIKRILEAKGISYVIVNPRITKPSPRHENYYKQLMTDGMLPFEKIIAPTVSTAARNPTLYSGVPVAAARAEIRAAYDALRRHPEADPSILERYLSGDPGPVLGKAVIYDAYALGKIKEPELGPEIELGESEIALVRGTPEQLERVKVRTSVTRCFLLKITGSLGGERLMFAAHFTAGQFERMEQAVRDLIPPLMNVEERQLTYSEYAFSRWPDRRGAFDAFIQNLRFSEKEINRLDFSDREPYAATLAPLRSEARVAFTNTGEEKEHGSNGEIPVSGYHRIIKELFKGKDFLDHTLQRVIPGQDITPFILASTISVTFIACAAETRIYRVSVRPVSGGKPVVFALAVGQDSRVFEDQEAAKRRAHGEAPYSVKQEFLNLQKMNRILPQNVVEPYVYMESGAQGLPQFPIFSMQYAAGSHAIYAIYASDAFRLVSQLGSKSMWQMVENDFRKFLKHFFKLQIQLFLGTGEVFHIALPQGDLMYPAQTATKPVGPPYPFDSKQEFKTVPYDETLPLMLTSGSFSAKATKGFLVQTLFGGEQVVNSQRRWRLDSPFFSLPYKDVAVAFYLAMEDLFPEEGKEKTIEWLQAYLEEYESFERPEVVTFVKKIIQELSENIASDKTKTGDAQARSEVRLDPYSSTPQPVSADGRRAEVRSDRTQKNVWVMRDAVTGKEKGLVYQTPFMPQPQDRKDLDKAWADFHQMVFDFPKILEQAARARRKLPVVLVVPEDLDGFSPLADEAPWIEGARVVLAWASAYYRFKELGNVDVRVLRVPRSGVSQKQITKAVQLLAGKKIKPVPGTPEEQFEARMFTLAAVLGTTKVPSKNLVLDRRSLTTLDGVRSRPAERVILRPKLPRIPEGKQRILVVGGAGFIGTNLVQSLLAEGHQVIVMDSMVSANPFFETIFEGDTDLHLEKWDASRPFEIEGPVDLIFHLGSLASPVDYYGKPLETMRAGLMATKEVLELARRKRARFFFSSTSEVYGDPKVHPQPETYAGAVSPFKKRSQYDESKRGAETLIKLYHERYAGAERLDLRIARLFNTYGPYMRIDDGRVVTNFIQKIFANEPIEIYGDERITRSFGFVDDTLGGILKLVRTEHLTAETPITERVFNIGNDGEFTLRDLADLTNRLGEKYLKRTVPIKIVPIKDPTDPNRRRPDLTRARTRLDYKPSVSLREGFEKTFLYFMLHREALKGFDRRSEAREKSAGQAEELRRGVTVLRGGEKGPDYSNGDEEIAIADERARPAGEGLAKKEVHRRSLKDTDSDSRDVWDKIKRTVMNGQGPFEPLEAGRRSEARAYSRRDWLKLTVKGAFAAGLFGFAACCQKEKIDNKEEESHDREGIIFESGNWKIWGTRDTGPEARIVKTPRGNFSEFKVVYRNDQLFSVKGNGYLRSVLPSSYRGPKGEKVDWGTSFVLPGYWSNGVYHHNPKITQAEIREGPDGTVTLKGVMEDQAGNWVAKDLAITFRKPMAESVEAEISFTQTAQKSFSVDAARAGDGEGWKVLQFSSMNIGTAHDADFVMYRDKDGQMASQAVAGENKLIFEKAQPLGGSPVYLANQKPSPWGNRPTTFIQMMPDSSPGVFSAQGWVARSSDPNDDNLGVWVHLDGVKNSYQAGETIARVHAVLGTTRPGLPLVAPSVSPKGVIDGAAVASFMPAEDVRRSEVREGTAREAARTVLQITRAGAKEFAPHADGGYHLDDLLDEANWTRTVLYTGAAAGSFLERTQRFEHETQVIVPADTEVTVTTGGESFTLTEPGIIGMSHGAEASVTVARGEVIVTTADRSPSWYRWTEDSGKNDTGKIWEKGSIVVYRHQGRQNWFDLKNGVSSHTEWMMDSTTQKFPRSLFPPIMGVSRVDYTDRQGIFPFHSLRPAENLHEHPVVNANWELVETYMVTRGAAVLAYFLQDEQGRFRPETVVLRPGDAAFVRPGTIHDLVAVEAPYEHVVTFTPSVHQYGFSFKRQVNDDEVGMDRAALTEAAMNLLRSEARFRSEAQESDDEDRFNSQLRATIGAFRLTPAQVETVRTKEKFIADIYRGVLEELFPGGVLWVKALGSSARLTFAGGQPDFDICGNVQANESVLEQKLGFLFDGIREKFVQEGYEFKPSTYTANGFRRQLHALNKTGPYYVLVLDVKSLETGETLHADLTVKFDQEEEEIKKGISDTYLIRFKEEIARIRKERGDRAAEDLLADIRFTRDVFQKTGIENGRFRGGFVSVNAEQLVMQTGGFDQAMEFLFRIGTEDGRAISLKDAKRKPWPLRVITPAVDGEMLGWIDEDHWDRLIDLSRRYVQQKKDGRFDLSSLISPRSEARAAQSSPAGPRLEARNIPAAVQREAKSEVVTTLGMVARERGRRAGTTNTGLGVKLTEPVVIVVEKARLDALSGTAMRQLMAFAAINRGKLYLVVPDLLQGPESSYVAELKALGVRVMRELPGIARDAKTSVIGLSDKEQDTAEAFRERLRPGVAAGVREYFALEEGEGLFLALLVEQPEDLPLKNGFRYDRSGRFRDALGSLLRTLSDYVVVSKVIGAAA